MNVNEFEVHSGDIVDSNNQVQNIVSLFQNANPVSEKTVNKNDYVIHSGLIIGADNKLYDIAELITENGGTDDYDELTNKPSINGVTLTGNKTSSDLGVIPNEGNTLENENFYFGRDNMEITTQRTFEVESGNGGELSVNNGVNMTSTDGSTFNVGRNITATAENNVVLTSSDDSSITLSDDVDITAYASLNLTYDSGENLTIIEGSTNVFSIDDNGISTIKDITTTNTTFTNTSLITKQYVSDNTINEAIVDVTVLPTGSNIKDVVYRLASTVGQETTYTYYMGDSVNQTTTELSSGSAEGKMNVVPDFPLYMDNNTSYSYYWIETDTDNQTITVNFSPIQDYAPIEINWGDGTAIEQYSYPTTSTTHIYSDKNKYLISFNNLYGDLGGGTNSTQFITPSSCLLYIQAPRLQFKPKDYAFYNCYKLKKVNLYKSNVSDTFYIKDYCFAYCSSLDSFSINDENANYKDKVQIGSHAFEHCTSLLYLNIERINSIGELAFNYSTVSSFRNNYYFENSNPLANTAFANSGFSKLYIGDNNFNASSIPNSFKEVHITNPIPQTFSGSISQYSNLVIYVPKGTAATYKAASGWSTYADRIVEEGAFDKLSTTGGALTGDITTTNTTFTNSSLVTKQYVDDTIAALDANSTAY